MIERFKKLWSLIPAAEKRKALRMLLLVLLMAAAEAGSVLSILPFLSILGRPDAIKDTPLLLTLYTTFSFQDSRSFIIALGLTTITVVIASSTFKIFTQHALNRFVHFQRHSLSCRLLARYLHQPYEFFLDRNSALLSKNVLSEVDRLSIDLIQPLCQLLAQSVVVLAMASLIFFYDPWTAVCAVGVLGVLYGGIYSLVRKRLLWIGRERKEANGERYQACNEVLGGIKDVKVTHATSAYLEKFSQASRQFSRHTATNDTLNQSPLYLVETIGYAGLITIALILLARSDDVAHVLPALGLYGFASYRMLPAAQIIYRGFAKLTFSSAILDSIHHDLHLPEEAQSTSSQSLTLHEEIRLRGVYYSYPSSPDKAVIDNLDLVIPANTSLGIIGRSGTGKSTLMDILLGLLSPQAGTFEVDGEPITAENLSAWQRTIGYVPQHIYLADASVAENIAFGVPKELVDMKAVERAARAAQIHNFVSNNLPQGYNTRVGDRGVRLSGGQRQRIGIARALYRDPAVLLMDEATSALDSQTEEAVNESVRNLVGEKTLIIIAHRETSLVDCQRIVSLSPETDTPSSG